MLGESRKNFFTAFVLKIFTITNMSWINNNALATKIHFGIVPYDTTYISSQHKIRCWSCCFDVASSIFESIFKFPLFAHFCEWNSLKWNFYLHVPQPRSLKYSTFSISNLNFLLFFVLVFARLVVVLSYIVHVVDAKIVPRRNFSRNVEKSFKHFMMRWNRINGREDGIRRRTRQPMSPHTTYAKHSTDFLFSAESTRH